MISAIHSVWPLMLGFFFIVLGQGLHSTLIGIRAGIENFDPVVTGIVISFYTAGLLCGTFFSGRLIQRIGHIRAYAMASAISSAAMLMYVLVVNPFFWGFTRFLIGMAMTLIYAATESWLNDNAENHNRGAFLSVYMVVNNLGMGCGQFLLLVASPEGAELFVLLSVLLSVSIIPVLLTVRNVPSFDAPSRMGMMQLYKITPFGFVNVIFIGMLFGTLFVMAGVYTSEEGFSLFDTSLFVSALIFAPAITQTPIGRLSDRIDRRLVIIPLLIISIIILFVIISIPDLSVTGKIICTGLLAGFLIPVHGLIMAHTNDFMTRQQMVGASNALLRLFSCGALISPPVVGFVMEIVGSAGYFYFMLVIAIVMVSYSLLRVGIRWGALQAERSRFVGLPTTAGSTVAATMNPEAGLNEGSTEVTQAESESQKS